MYNLSQTCYTALMTYNLTFRNFWDWLRWRLFPNRDIRRFDTDGINETN